NSIASPNGDACSEPLKLAVEQRFAMSVFGVQPAIVSKDAVGISSCDILGCGMVFDATSLHAVEGRGTVRIRVAKKAAFAHIAAVAMGRGGGEFVPLECRNAANSPFCICQIK